MHDVSGQNCSRAPVKVLSWYLNISVGTSEPVSKAVNSFADSYQYLKLRYFCRSFVIPNIAR